MFWDRADLKEKAKNSLRTRYWVCVFVGLILSLFVYGETRSSNGRYNESTNINSYYDTMEGTLFQEFWVNHFFCGIELPPQDGIDRTPALT